MNFTLADFYKLLLADLTKAPLLVADFTVVKTDSEKLLTDAGLPIPWAGTVAVAHTAEEDQLYGQVIDAFRNEYDQWTTEEKYAPLRARALESDAFSPEKLGDGTLLKSLQGFLSSPLGQMLLSLLLGKLTGGGTAPAPAPALALAQGTAPLALENFSGLLGNRHRVTMTFEPVRLPEGEYLLEAPAKALRPDGHEPVSVGTKYPN
jgi:hypothetical protein